jgi:hypothetical protein
LLPPALPERCRRCGHLHDQTTLAVADGNEVVVLVEGLCFVVYGINEDESAAADFRCGRTDTGRSEDADGHGGHRSRAGPPFA